MGVMLDLFSSPPEKGYVEALREEAARVLAEDGGRWTKAGVAKLIRIDSTIKESMRWKGGSARGLPRTVSHPTTHAHSHPTRTPSRGASKSESLSPPQSDHPTPPTQQVIQRDGFTFEDGVHIPYGFKVGVPQYPIHLDEDFYPNPKLWDPFRFSREREEFEHAQRCAAAKDTGTDTTETPKGSSGENAGILRFRNEAMVSTNDRYLAWGHGRHAW
jgi:hypothetical protein